MEKKDILSMSNAEIKIYLTTLENEYEAKKNELKEICEYMEKLENYYHEANKELNMRKNIYV